MKNIDKSSSENTLVEDGFLVLRYENNSSDEINKNFPVTREFIQFHFCLKGSGKLLFNGGNYEFKIS